MDNNEKQSKIEKLQKEIKTQRKLKNFCLKKLINEEDEEIKEVWEDDYQFHSGLLSDLMNELKQLLKEQEEN